MERKMGTEEINTTPVADTLAGAADEAEKKLNLNSEVEQ